MYTHDLVSRRFRAVPRTTQRDKRIAFEIGGKLIALIEDKIEQGGMGFEQDVRSERRLHLFWIELRKTRLRVRTDITIGPPVKTAFLHARQIIGNEAIAEAVALLHDGIEIAASRLKCERRRITHTSRICRLVRAVSIEALNGSLDFRFDAKIAGRTHA